MTLANLLLMIFQTLIWILRIAAFIGTIYFGFHANWPLTIGCAIVFLLSMTAPRL